MSNKKNNKNMNKEDNVMENKNEVKVDEVKVEVTEAVKEKRSRKTFEQAKEARLAVLDQKIAETERYLESLRAKRQEEADRQPKQRAKSVKSQANELVASLVAQGKSIDEIKQMLGV